MPDFKHTQQRALAQAKAFFEMVREQLPQDVAAEISAVFETHHFPAEGWMLDMTSTDAVGGFYRWAVTAFADGGRSISFIEVVSPEPEGEWSHDIDTHPSVSSARYDPIIHTNLTKRELRRKVLVEGNSAGGWTKHYYQPWWRHYE